MYNCETRKRWPIKFACFRLASQSQFEGSFQEANPWIVIGQSRLCLSHLWLRSHACACHACDWTVALVLVTLVIEQSCLCLSGLWLISPACACRAIKARKPRLFTQLRGQCQEKCHPHMWKASRLFQIIHWLSKMWLSSPKPEFVGTTFKIRKILQWNWLLYVHVLHKTLIFVISRCWCAENDKEMHQKRLTRTELKPFSLLSPSWFDKVPS